MHVKEQRSHQGGISRIEAFRPSLLRLAEARLDRQLRTKLDADDIVQEAMVKAYLGLGHLRTVEEPSVVRNWLRRILTRVLSDQRKRTSRIFGESQPVSRGD